MYGVFWIDAAGSAGEDRGERLGQQDVARAVVVAGGDGALGVVDAADDGRQRERQRDRQARPSVSPSASSQASVGHGIARRHSPGAVSAWLPGAMPGPALHHVDRRSRRARPRARPGTPARQRDPPDEGDEDQPERDEARPAGPR